MSRSQCYFSSARKTIGNELPKGDRIGAMQLVVEPEFRSVAGARQIPVYLSTLARHMAFFGNSPVTYERLLKCSLCPGLLDA